MAHKLSWFSTDHVGVLLPKIKKKFPKIPTDGWLSQHQLGFLYLLSRLESQGMEVQDPYINYIYWSGVAQ